MSARAAGSALAALALASCASPAPGPGNDVAAEAVDPLSNIAAASQFCPELNAQLTAHPEADAEAAFARKDLRFRELVVLSVERVSFAPGVPEWDKLPPGCKTGAGSLAIKGGTDTRACDDFNDLARIYVERFNRTMMRLCAAAPH